MKKRMNATAKKLLTILDKATNDMDGPSHSKKYETLFGDLPPVRVALLQKLMRILNRKLPKQDLDKISADHAEYSRMLALMREHFPDKTRQRYVAQTSDIAAVVREKGAAVGRIQTFEELDFHDRSLVKGIKQNLTALSQSTFASVAPHVESIAADIESFARKLNMDDGKVASELGIDHTPSSTALMIFKAASRLRLWKKSFNANSGTPPNAIAAIFLEGESDPNTTI